MSFLALRMAADAFFKGNQLVAFGVVMLVVMAGVAVGMAFLLRWLHRHAPRWWRWPAIVWCWILLFGSVLWVVQLAYVFATGGDVLLATGARRHGRPRRGAPVMRERTRCERLRSFGLAGLAPCAGDSRLMYAARCP